VPSAPISSAFFVNSYVVWVLFVPVPAIIGILPFASSIQICNTFIFSSKERVELSPVVP